VITVIRRRPVALAAVLSAGVLLAGCTGAAPEPAAPDPQIEVDPALAALLPDDVREAGRLLVGTDPSYPPASSYGADGRTIVGFEPDLGAALGDLLGIEVEFRAEPFDELIDGLGSGTSDVVMSAMTDTTEREERADFVTYFQAGTSIVVQRGNPFGIHDLADLCGRSVAVEEGTVQIELLARSQEHCSGAGITVQTEPSNDDALLELRTGRVAAVLNDYPPAVHVTSTGPSQAFFQLVSDVQYEPGLYGIVVGKDRPELRDALAAALTRLLETGDYRRVMDRWDVSSGAVRAVTVNGTPVAP
jgi:polar amino acid transport system substrate-binding protein